MTFRVTFDSYLLLSSAHAIENKLLSKWKSQNWFIKKHGNLIFHLSLRNHCYLIWYWFKDPFKTFLQSLTNEYKADSYDVRQHVGSEGLIVVAVTFAKEADERVDMVLAKTLLGSKEKHAGKSCWNLSWVHIPWCFHCSLNNLFVPGKLWEQKSGMLK